MSPSVTSVFVAVTLLSIVTFVYGDVRCHCNLPECVRAGYMCTATGPQAACFVEHAMRIFVDDVELSSLSRSGASSGGEISRHGCIDMLPVKERNRCLSDALARLTASVSVGQAAQTNGNGRKPNSPVQCCLDDHCNSVRDFVIENAGEDEDDTGTDDSSVNKDSFTNKNDIDSLAKHLQEIYGTSHVQERALWIELSLVAATLVALAALFILIAYGIRFVRSQGGIDKRKHSTPKKCKSNRFNPGKFCHTPGTTILNIDPNPYSTYYSASQLQHLQHQHQHHQQSQQQPLLIGLHIDSNGMTIAGDDYGYNKPRMEFNVSHLPEVVANSIRPASLSLSSDNDTESQ